MSETVTLRPYLKEEMERRITAAGNIVAGDTAQTADRVRSLGFENAANVKLAESALVMSMRDERVRLEYYAEHYPMCQWVSWRFLTRFCEALDLRVDSADHYVGVVPGEQLPYLEIASVEAVDLPDVRDMLDFSGVPREREGALRILLGLPAGSGVGVFDDSTRESLRSTGIVPSVFGDFGDVTRAVALRSSGMGPRVEDAWRQFSSSLFVVGPPDVFDRQPDWRERFRNLMIDVEISRDDVIGRDPLVFRAVKGGALIVAAWGDEGDHVRAALGSLSGSGAMSPTT